jgi:uncharacterized protein YdhG (YjbR/CyaY superfamily)
MTGETKPVKKTTSAAVRALTVIDSYIADFPQSTQEVLQRLRQVIREAAPDAVEAIKYRIPTFVLNGNLVHFAAFNRHIGFYPTPSAMLHFQKELAPYPSAKGSVQFLLNQPMPWDLIREMVLFRVTEVQGAKTAAIAKTSARTKTANPPKKTRTVSTDAGNASKQTAEVATAKTRTVAKPDARSSKTSRSVPGKKTK